MGNTTRLFQTPKRQLAVLFFAHGTDYCRSGNDLIGKASKALNSLRERAKTSKDAELKENISKLYDDFLDLKAVILRLTEENAELRRTIAAHAQEPPKPEIRQVGETNYYFVGTRGLTANLVLTTSES